MNRTLKVAFADYWGEKNIDEYFYHLLSLRYPIEISGKPDLLFYSVHGNEHLAFKCIKVFYTEENIKPDFRLCDYSFSFEATDEKNFQLPNFVRHPFFQEFRTQRFSPEIQLWRAYKKEKFCNFIHHNPYARKRIDFCKKLMRYKSVDCPGKVLHNIDLNLSKYQDWLEKLEIVKDYKFTIAFENKSAPNYTTEKIYHALLVGSIPIYWGNPRVDEYFNPESFINCHDYNNFDDVIEQVKAIDNDDALYRKYRNADPFLSHSKIHDFSEEAVMDRLQDIIDNIDKCNPVSRRFFYSVYSAYHQAYRFARYQVWRPLLHRFKSQY